MAKPKSFKVGSAPWEINDRPKSFKVGQAPWEQQSEPDQLQTALESYGNGVFLGYGPQIQAVLAPLVDRVMGAEPDKSTYTERRDQNIKRNKEQAEAHPVTSTLSGLAGNVVAGIAAAPFLPATAARGGTLAAKTASGLARGGATGAILGGVSNPGDIEGEISLIQPGARLKNAGIGAAVGGTLSAALPVIATTTSRAIKGVSGGLNDLAEKSALNATGATGKQASKFSDDAGRQLLDRGIVRFGDSQEKIAERAAHAVEKANAQIDSSLAKLEANGVKVDANDIYGSVRARIDQLKADPSAADIARNLEGELDNLIAAVEVRGSAKIGIKEAEQIKRGYNRKAGNWQDPEKAQSGKTMYQTTRRSVEKAAREADPETARLFEEAKKSYGLLSPIEEAAERRANTTAQSPAGGLADLTAAGAGFLQGGPVGALAAPIARRLAAPRLSSTVAVTADKMAKALRGVPEIAELEFKQPGLIQGFVSEINSLPQAPLPQVAKKDKGPEKWAQDGFEKLRAHGAQDLNQEELMKDKKTKDLLIQASDLEPGTQAMDRLQSRIRSRLEKGN